MNPVLKSLTMRGLKTVQLADGELAWSGTICRNGRPLLRVSNEGRGGCNDYVPVKGGLPAMRVQLAEFEAAARAATGLDFEAFDAVTAAMDNGQNAAEVVPLVVESFR